MGRLKGSGNVSKPVSDAIMTLKACHHAWSAEKIRREMKSYINGKTVPGTRAIQRILSEKREGIEIISKRYDSNEFQELEKPWHMGLTLKPEYTLSAEAISYVNDLKYFCQTHKEWPHGNEYPPFTIRKALWAAKIYRYVQLWAKAGKDQGVKKKNAVSWIMRQYYAWVNTYTEYECQSILAGNSTVDTTKLDDKLHSGELAVGVAVLYMDGKPIDDAEYPSFMYLKDKTISRITLEDGEA